MTERIPMTPTGQRKLRERLQYLKSVERPKIVLAIEEARSHGDLSENAEYDAAKEAQQQMTLEIQEIDHKLSLAQVIDPTSIKSDRVAFGATVAFEEEDGTEKMYMIVGEDEADVLAGLISIKSPIARAFLGKEAGDEAIINTPRGKKYVNIVSVEYK